MNRILVIDDEHVVRKLVAELLTRAGHEVVAVETGELGLDELARTPWDVVLTDLSLPGVSGAALVRALGATRPGIPVIVMTGSDLESAEGLPPDVPLLAKPFTGKALAEALTRVLAPARTRLVVAEDHPAVRASLVAFFGAQRDFEIVGTASNGREAVDLSADLDPDLVLMDIRMPVLDGIEATRIIKEAQPAVRIVMLSAYEQDELIQAGERAGAEGFLLKGVPGAELVSALRSLAA